MFPRRFSWMLLAPLVLQAGSRFDPVKDMSASVSGGVLSVSMPPGVHLKARAFRVTLVSRGALRLGAFPPPDAEDETGEPIWRGTLHVELKGAGLENPARLVVSYQPCTEGPDGVCFLPVKRTLVMATTEIPAETP